MGIVTQRDSIGQRRFNIELVNVKRHILLGGVVGACVAIAFSLVLMLQFDAALEIGFMAVTIPVCAVLGGVFGWVWWRWFVR